MSRDYKEIPGSTLTDLMDYVHHGRQFASGHFLSAVLENDLRKAFEHGDLANIAALWAIVTWLYNRAPQGCWGSKEAVKRWREIGGLTMINPTQEDRDTYRAFQLRDTVLEVV